MGITDRGLEDEFDERPHRNGRVRLGRESAYDKDAFDEHEYLVGAPGGIGVPEVGQFRLEEATQPRRELPGGPVGGVLGIGQPQFG